MKLHSLTVPCIPFGVRVRPASKGLTPIELTTLEAVLAGLEEVPVLEQLIGLGQRPVLDLVHDLWLNGYLVVDAVMGRVLPSAKARSEQGAGKLAQLKSAERNVEVISVMRELVSGTWLPLLSSRTEPPGGAKRLVPTEHTRDTFADVDRTALRRAVEDQVQWQFRGQLRSDLAIAEAWLEPHSVPADAGQTRYLSLEAEVSLEEDSGRLEFRVREPMTLPASVRRTLGEGLARLADRMPDHALFKGLREDARGFTRPSASAREKLNERVERLDGLDPGLAAQHHEELVSLLREAEAEVSEHHRAEAAVTLLEGQAAHDEAIGRLINEARHQVVLGNPWIRAEALLRPRGELGEHWLSLLRAALERGVQVVVLWGMRPDAELEATVRNALYDMANRFPDRCLFSGRPTALHAKFLVCDAREALVTSYNFLDPPRQEDTFELGALVQSRSPRPPTEDPPPPEAILALLDEARRAFPEYEKGRRIFLLPSELGASEVPLSTPASLPEQPGPTAPEIQHWAHQWQALAGRLEHQVRSLGGQVALVVDQDHRHLLWRALRATKQRLVITSDQVSTDVVTDRFVVRVRERLAQGAQGTFLFRRAGATDDPEGPAARLETLAREHEHLRVEAASSHAKVLICDQEVTLGSFNFLSFAGEYRAGRRERREFSFRIIDPAVTAEVQSLLAQRWPRAFPAAPVAPTLILPGPQATASLPSVQPLLRQLASEAVGPTLRRWFERSESPWADLAALEQAGLAHELMKQAVAAAVSFPHEAPEAQHWRGWLAEACWQAGDFIAAALLHPGDPCALPLELALLGAQVQAGHPPDPPVPTESTAGAVLWLSLAALLAQGQPAVLEIGDQITLDAKAEGWWLAAKTYWSTVAQALPIELLQRVSRRFEHHHAVQEAWVVADRQVERARRTGFDFTLGERTWSHLQKPDQLLGKLRDQLNRKAAADAMVYLADLNFEAAMDAASQAMATAHDARIERNRRKTCLKRLDEAVEAVQIWAKRAVQTTESAEEARLLNACRVLLTGMAGLNRAPVSALDGPAHTYLIEQLAPLFAANLAETP